MTQEEINNRIKELGYPNTRRDFNEEELRMIESGDMPGAKDHWHARKDKRP